MYNIILACEHGASTSIVTEAMRKAAKRMGIEANINAYPYTDLADLIDGADAILLGPQIRFRLSDIQKKFEDKNVPISVINPVDYGSLNGEKIMNIVIEQIKNAREGAR